jgi:hypothetical protein
MSTHIIRAESFVCHAPITVSVVNAFGSMTEHVAAFVHLNDEDI